jgi:hypothetical protein
VAVAVAVAAVSVVLPVVPAGLARARNVSPTVLYINESMSIRLTRVQNVVDLLLLTLLRQYWALTHHLPVSQIRVLGNGPEVFDLLLNLPNSGRRAAL